MNRMNRFCQGFSVTELMVSIAVGVMLMTGVIGIYLDSKTTFNVQNALARLQENGRFANYQLSYELRMVGYQGCPNMDEVQITNLISSSPQTINPSQSLSGHASTGSSFSPALPSNLSTLANPAGDVLVIRRASTTSVQLNRNMNRANNPILVYDKLGFKAGDRLMITDCSFGDIFIAGSNTNSVAITHTNSNNISNNLSKPYAQTNAKVMYYLYYAYYLKNTGRLNRDNQPIMALYRQDIDGTEHEIAEGVERMRITYGVDTNGDNSVDAYQTAVEVQNGNNWNNVLTIAINLLMATPENVSDKSQTYTFNGVSTTPTDRKLRRQWDTVVALRNRGS